MYSQQQVNYVQNPLMNPQFAAASYQSFVPQNPNDINAGQHYPPPYQHAGMMNNLNNANYQSWNPPNTYAQ